MQIVVLNGQECKRSSILCVATSGTGFVFIFGNCCVLLKTGGVARYFKCCFDPEAQQQEMSNDETTSESDGLIIGD